MNKEISYSDGEIENEILQALRIATDVSSNSSISTEKQRKSWPFEYHLSRDRANIVRHLNFKGKRVLEIGAGMGAVSRYVAEQCSFLQVVEGTSRRLSCLQERLRGNSNYNVYCGNFRDFQSSEKFDVILIIGVIEYAEIYFGIEEDQNPHIEFLKKAKSLLAEDGSVVLAIENRLGLKYWAGASEDHTGNLFDGILGYRKSKSVRTFSKNELKTVFNQAGYSSISIQYPFPDYKIPKCILTEELELKNPRLFADIAGAQIARDYSDNRIVLFSDPVAMDSFVETGLLGEFSNSFLFIAGGAQRKNIQKFPSDVGYSYSRGRNLNCVTRFVPIGNRIQVVKSLANGAETTVDYGPITWKKPNDSLVENGILLMNHFRRLISFREWDLFEADWRKYLLWIANTFQAEKESLQGGAWDLIPQNILVSENATFEIIDHEWFYNKPFEKSWFILRSLLSFDVNIQQTITEKYSSMSELYNLSCQFLGVHGKLREDCLREMATQNLISGESLEVNVDYVVESLEGRNAASPESVKSEIRTRLKNIIQESPVPQTLRIKNDLEILKAEAENIQRMMVQQRAALDELKRIKQTRIFKIVRMCWKLFSKLRAGFKNQ